MITKLNAVIVSQSLSWQRILSELLSRYSYIDIGDVVNGCLSAARRVTQDYPDILVIDCTVSGDDISALIKHVKSVNSKAKIIIIADTHHQKMKFNSSGADFVALSFSYDSDIEEALSAIWQTAPDFSVND